MSALRPSIRVIRYWTGRIGPAGFIGLLLLAAVAIYYSVVMLPLEAQNQVLRSQVTGARERLELAAAQRGQMAPVTEQEKLGAFYKKFPARNETPDLLAQVYKQAELQQVALDEGEYLPATSKDMGLETLRISFPVKGSYAQIRNFIGATLVAIPTLSLDNVSFRREKVSDEIVDAKLTLVLYMGPRQ